MSAGLTPSDEAREALARILMGYDIRALTSVTDTDREKWGWSLRRAARIVAAGWVPAAEYDAAIRLAQEANDDCRRWAGLLQEAKAERDAALAVIEKAKAWRGWYEKGEPVAPSEWKHLDSILATVDTPALAAHDAETRRQAIAEAADWVDDWNAEHDIDNQATGAVVRALAVEGADA